MCNMGRVGSDKVVWDWVENAARWTILLGFILLVIFCVAKSCSAATVDVTYVYLVDASSFPQDRFRTSSLTAATTSYKTFKTVGMSTITKSGRQPFRMTRYNKSHNKKYALWTVTPTTAMERQWLKSMTDKKYVTLLSVIEMRSEYDKARGGYLRRGYEQKLQEIPADFYPTVAISTSTKGGPVK